MDRLDYLIKTLVGWGVGETMIGKGSMNPIKPNPLIVTELDQIFANYSFLRNEEGYVEFLKRYGGLHVERPEELFFIHIFGIDDHMMSLLVPDEGYQNHQGYLPFAMITLPERSYASEIDFAWNVEEPPHKIYRLILDDTQQDKPRFDYRLYCDSFMDWLEAVVEHEGRLLN